MSGFRKDFEWQSRFLPAISHIIGPQLLEPAPIDLDMHEATDLVVLRARDMRIGCRIRRVGYADSYPFDFTIRSHRDTGARTELQKIVDGWGDWFFYGHAEDNGLFALARWFLIDLAAFRAHLIRDRDAVMPRKKSNGDGTSFAVFDVRQFRGQPSLLISASHDIPESPPQGELAL